MQNLCMKLTQWSNIHVLSTQQEEVDGHLLARTVECQFLVEIGGRVQVGDIFWSSLIRIFSRLQLPWTNIR